MAKAIGVLFVTIPGRGHWLFSGRTLERVVAEVQRFLVRSFGRRFAVALLWRRLNLWCYPN